MIRFLRQGSRAAALFAVVCCATASADVVVGKQMSLYQPDGTEVQVRVWGDEFYTHVESLDGYTLIRDSQTNEICYAELNDAGRLVSTGLVAGSGDPAARGMQRGVREARDVVRQIVAERRADFEARRYSGPLAPENPGRDAGPRATGSIVGITILIDFPDDPATIPSANVEAYCNEIGYTGYGNNGSVRDYFTDVSNGLLDYTNFVPDTYYRAANPKTYYNDTSVDFGIRARELVIEALTWLDDTGTDFSQYDSNNDGIVDALNIFYAGNRDVAWAEGLWPHAWTVSFSADGVSTNRYQMTDIGNSLKLGTFVHENGHMLMGWPDLYDYGYESAGVGRFCVMCYGAYDFNPVEPCAWMKLRAGWATVTDLVEPADGLTLTAGANSMFRYPHPTNSNEFFLLENRRKTGRDSGLPDEGLAIWHVDEFGSNNNEQQTPSQHYLVTLVQADGDWDLENNANSGDNTDLWDQNFSLFSDFSNPDSRWWSGAISGLNVSGISPPGDVVSFDYSNAQDCNNNGIPDSQEIQDGSVADCDGNGLPDSCDIDNALATDCNGNGIPDSCDVAAGAADCNGNGLLDACEDATSFGLVTTFYDNIDLTGMSVTQIDTDFMYNWGSNAPLPGFGANTFSARWEGTLRSAGFDGMYLFSIVADDGVRLWVDGELIIDAWIDQGPTEWIGEIELQRNSEYPIRVEYYENGGGATMQLQWRVPSGQLTPLAPPWVRAGSDCNGNGVPDSCDIASGVSPDADGDGVPDECQSPTNPSDLNADGCVDSADLNLLLSEWNCSGSCGADISGDGVVDSSDLNLMLSAWSSGC